MCLYPTLVINPKYKANKKNGGKPPELRDERLKYVPIGCGNCIECRRKKARTWKVRLEEDIKEHTNGKFITLTFSNEAYSRLYKEMEKVAPKLEGYEKDNEIAKLAVKRWLERWRKKTGRSMRHWLVTELGHEGSENIHMHGIIWTDVKLEEVERVWSYGYMWKYKEGDRGEKINYVNEATIGYVVKYVTKTDEEHRYYKARILCSPGIGRRYVESGNGMEVNRYQERETKEYWRARDGSKISLPEYYRGKIYSEEERERLWQYKLDKGERWVLGRGILVKDIEDALRWEKMMKAAKELNEELGYGNDRKDMGRYEHEKAKRIAKQLERVKEDWEKWKIMAMDSKVRNIYEIDGYEIDEDGIILNEDICREVWE